MVFYHKIGFNLLLGGWSVLAIKCQRKQIMSINRIFIKSLAMQVDDSFWRQGATWVL